MEYNERAVSGTMPFHGLISMCVSVCACVRARVCVCVCVCVCVK